jgi:hypothetical protein
MPAYSLVDPAILPFIVIPVLLVATLGWGVRAAWQRNGASDDAAWRASGWVLAASAAWMALTWLAAASGILREWDRNPPPFAFFVVAVISLAALLSLSSVGSRLATLPLWIIVAVQSFRFPLELAMHTMHERGIMPEVMSYSGRNFDILTGITALMVAALVATRRAGRRTVIIWNVIGIALLVNVVVVAILATPRFRYFGDGQLNVWVTYPPFVWLPAVMVLAALAGHIIVFRAVRLVRRS